MRRWRRWHRTLGVTWAVLQVVLPLAVAYADARLAAAGERPQRAHAESERTSACQPAHSPECGLCRFLSSHNATAVSPPLHVTAAAKQLAHLPSVPSYPRNCVGEIPRSRGPPQD